MMDEKEMSMRKYRNLFKNRKRMAKFIYIHFRDFLLEFGDLEIEDMYHLIKKEHNNRKGCISKEEIRNFFNNKIKNANKKHLIDKLFLLEQELLGEK